jgi:hypothetical protein
MNHLNLMFLKNLKPLEPDVPLVPEDFHLNLMFLKFLKNHLNLMFR